MDRAVIERVPSKNLDKVEKKREIEESKETVLEVMKSVSLV